MHLHISNSRTYLSFCEFIEILWWWKNSNLQLYFYDTEHEVQNRMAWSSKFKESIVQQLKSILDNNPYSVFIWKLADIENLDKYRIFLKSNLGLDQYIFNVPLVSQVATIWSNNENLNGEPQEKLRSVQNRRQKNS